MKIGLFQFACCDNTESNYLTMFRAIKKAKENNVRLLLFPECALTGYPPIEISSVKQIDFILVNKLIEKLYADCIANEISIVFGSVFKLNGEISNRMVFIDYKKEKVEYYSKRALWGWDKENYTSGNKLGVFEIDNYKFGIRICFEIRFPEYFRELFKEKVDFTVIAFSDTCDKPYQTRYDLIKSHILTRAVENAFTVLTTNSISFFQTAPTCVVSPDGDILLEAKQNEEELIIYDYNPSEINFGRRGRLEVSEKLTSASTYLI